MERVNSCCSGGIKSSISEREKSQEERKAVRQKISPSEERKVKLKVEKSGVNDAAAEKLLHEVDIVCSRNS